MIYSSWEKWTCMICRPSWTPSWISRNCQGLQGDTIIFLETGDLLKRLTFLAYLYHCAAHGTRFLNICCYTTSHYLIYNLYISSHCTEIKWELICERMRWLDQCLSYYIMRWSFMWCCEPCLCKCLCVSYNSIIHTCAVCSQLNVVW